MNSSSSPTKKTIPFANSGSKNAVPNTSQIGITDGVASYPDGFVPLNMTRKAAGGIPPGGKDINGVLFDTTALTRWFALGAGFAYDGAFVADGNILGYPNGARVMRSDGAGYWLNTIDGNTVDPESVTPGAAATAGWVPDTTNGISAVTMTSANVTLTPAQYGKPIIVLSGTLTADLNLIFPNIAGSWIVVCNCTGAHTVTCKTAAGTGVASIPGQKNFVFGDATNILSPQASRLQPTLTVLASGTGTYTTPAGCNRLHVRAVAGGNGGIPGGNSPGSATNGGNTTFGPLSCLAGSGSVPGVSSGGDFPSAGSPGAPGQSNGGSVSPGGDGGSSSPFGGGGAGGLGNGGNATGPGAGGGGGAGNTGYSSGSGGASGAYGEKTILNPAATYSYAVGAQGTGGIGGTGGFNSGNAASGIIVIDEYYN